MIIFCGHFINLLLGILTIGSFCLTSCEKTAESRSIDLSSQWRPMAMQVNPPINPVNHLISVATMDGPNKAQLLQIAQHNAQIMRQYKGLNQAATQYYSPYPMFPPTQSPVTLSANHAGHNKLNSVNFLSGKHGLQDINQMNYYNGHHSTTSKIPGVMKQGAHHNFPSHFGRILGGLNSLRDITLTPPPQPPVSSRPTQTPHPVLNKLQTHLAHASRPKQPTAAGSTRQESFIIPSSVLNQFSNYGPSHLIRDSKPISYYSIQDNSYTSQLTAPAPSKLYYGNNFDSHHTQTYNPPSSPSINSNDNSINKNKKNQHNNNNINNNNNNNYNNNFNHNNDATSYVSHSNNFKNSEQIYHNNVEHTTFNPQFPTVPPSVLSPFFQQIQQQQQNDHSTSNNNYHSNFVTPKEESSKTITDEFTRHLVPPPYKHKESSNFREKPSIQINPNSEQSDKHEKYNVQNLSPLQDANRYIYNTGPLLPSTTIQTSFASTEKPVNHNMFITTEVPNIFKHLSRPSESEYTQHKLMHPSYTGAKRPTANFNPTPSEPENNAITHSFFTIEDAITSSPFSSDNNYYHDFQKTVKPTYSHISHQQPSEDDDNVAPTMDFNKLKIERPTLTYPDIFKTEEEDKENKVPVTESQFVFSTTTTKPIRSREKIKMRRRRPKPQIENSYDDNELKVVSSAEPSKVQTSQPTRNLNRNRLRGKPMQSSEIEKPQRHRPIDQNSQKTRQQTETQKPPRQRNTKKPAESTTVVVEENPFVHSYKFSSNNRERKPVGTQETKHFLPTIQTDKDDIVEVRNPFAGSTIFYDKPNLSFETTPEIQNYVGFSTTALPFRDYSTRSNLIYSDFSSVQPEQGTEIHTDIDIDNVIETTTGIKSPAVFVENALGRFPKPENKEHRTRLRQDIAKIESIPVVEDVEEESFTEVIQNNKPTTVNEKIHENKNNNRIIKTSTVQTTTVSPTLNKTNRMKPISRYELKNRPRFSVKEYRQRLSSSTTESSIPGYEATTTAYTRLRFPTRNRLALESSKVKKPEESEPEKPLEESVDQNEIKPTDIVTEQPRKRFTVRDRSRIQTRPTTEATPSSSPRAATTARRGSNIRRDFANKNRIPVASVDPRTSLPTIRNISQPLRRPAQVNLRTRIQNFKKKEAETMTPAESSNTVSTEEADVHSVPNESEHDSITEGYKRETSIMKIAKDDHSYRPYAHTTTESGIFENDLSGSPSEQSQRVAELTISGHTDFKSVNTGILSRRVPGYFVPGLATEDPILPIEAFFPQVKN